MKAMRRQLDEAEEEISREKAHRRKVGLLSTSLHLFSTSLHLLSTSLHLITPPSPLPSLRPSASSTTMWSPTRG